MNKLLAILQKVPLFRLLVPVYIGLAILFGVLIARGNMQLLNPAGYIASIQSQLLWGGLIFACVVGGLLIVSFFMVAFRYRETSGHAYAPDWIAGKSLHVFVWLIPLLAIAAISIVVWQTAHQVDPYQSIVSAQKPVVIQVVALRWKWLFLYPNDGIATVNSMEIPVGAPVELQLTADAPMNSFWVPRLAGQVYAMTGMVTKLHLRADQPGDYAGDSNEISGDGFSGMNFTVKAVAASTYNNWRMSQQHHQSLDFAAYTKLAQPSSDVAPATYKLTDADLFHKIVMQFMQPTNNSTMQTSNGMSM